ncbi:MAG: efflux RND transporter periplasmic adaptor subunit [Candidatus Acinetobacter avistercoris]|uniref:efflux RND transporter periplasmic adaptor subunit n=1 Tax=Acinetobacter sp. KS-LM10 TaxID=3120518 RepID=UPI001FA25C42|nr:efflux RND transporter periplasmic adaptor subunit [Candidatus Acinetobacter avistercoris]
MKNNNHIPNGKTSQKVLIFLALIITTILAFFLFFSGKSKNAAPNGHGDETENAEKSKITSEAQAEGNETAESHEDTEEDGILHLTAQQIAEQGIQLAATELGQVSQVVSYPAKLMANTDRQAHVSPNFSGRVEAVQVELGQAVKKGQVLASLFVPELVDQQSNLQIAQSSLNLAQQDYAREQKLWSQGVSAKQDFQRASNAVEQARIQVQTARSRLSAYGASPNSRGRYNLIAPISGVISQKDIVVGENVQTATQLFIINQLDQLWLEFILPSEEFDPTLLNQEVKFKSLQTNKTYKAKIQTLNTEADQQTGRLQVRAKVISDTTELRPNLMVNVELNKTKPGLSLRVLKTAIQQIEQKNVIFVATQTGKQFEFKAQNVELGEVSADGQWIALKSGLKQGQTYVAQGSFLLKSEMEKGEASHGH